MPWKTWRVVFLSTEFVLTMAAFRFGLWGLLLVDALLGGWAMSRNPRRPSKARVAVVVALFALIVLLWISLWIWTPADRRF